MSAINGFRAYFASAAAIGATLGVNHGRAERKRCIQTTIPEEGIYIFRDAVLGACMYPLYIPLLPLYAFKNQQICPFHK